MVKTMNITLNSIDMVKNLVNILSRVEGEAFISSGRYIVNAKSIMGIFSLDLSKPMVLKIEEWKEEYEELLKACL